MVRRSLVFAGHCVALALSLCCGSVSGDDGRAPSRPAQDAVREACGRVGPWSLEVNRIQDELDAVRLEGICRSAEARLEGVEQLEILSSLVSCETDKREVGNRLSDVREGTARMLRGGDAVTIQKLISITSNKRIASAGAKLRQRILEAAELLERLDKTAK